MTFLLNRRPELENTLMVKNRSVNRIMFLAAMTAMAVSKQGIAAVIVDVDFSDGLVPPGAFVIDDSANGVHVVPSAGNLNDTPLLLTGKANDLVAVAFYFPQVSEGRYAISWDSLVLTIQPEDKTIDGWDRSFVALLATDSTSAQVPWSLEYDASGQMLLGCCDASIPVSSTSIGAYVPGRSDHFDLLVDLDFGSYSLKVNGESKVANASLLFGALNGIVFESPGRGFRQDPAALAADNIKVQLIPEPASLSLLALVVPALIRRKHVSTHM